MKKQSMFNTLFVCFLLVVILPSCSKSTETYYPLKEGRIWEYQMSAKSVSGHDSTVQVIMTNFAPRELKGKKVTPQKVDAGGQSSFIFISEDAEGIYEFATQLPGAVEPEFNADPRCFIKYPIKVGTSWDVKTTTSFMVKGVPVTLKSSIESIDEVITVPAGTFKGCVKIKDMGTTKQNLGPFVGVVTINVEYYNWYAPGVGHVRSIMKEKSDKFLMGDGVGPEVVTFQLESFKK